MQWRRWLMLLALLTATAPVGVRANDTAAAASLLQAAQAAAERGDEASALALLRRLAIMDVAEGQYRLGLLLHQPRSGAAPDLGGAAYWYERAAEQGHAAAASRLGDLHADSPGGRVRRPDEPPVAVGQALRWYDLTAKRGDAAPARRLPRRCWHALTATTPQRGLPPSRSPRLGLGM